MIWCHCGHEKIARVDVNMDVDDVQKERYSDKKRAGVLVLRRRLKDTGDRRYERWRDTCEGRGNIFVAASIALYSSLSSIHRPLVVVVLSDASIFRKTLMMSM